MAMKKSDGADVDAVDEDDGEEEGGLDLARIKLVVGFFLRAPRRHPRIAFGVGAAVLVIALACAAFLPRTYTSETRILAHRNLVLPALGNPKRSIPLDADNPVKGVADEIMKRDNIVALVKQLDLVTRFEATRPPALRLKDRIMHAISGPLSDEQKLRALVGILEKRLTVWTDNDSLNITVEWTDGEMAYELVNAVHKNFLEARYDSDVKVVNEAITILETREKTTADAMDAALAELTRIELQRRAGGGATAAPAPAPAPIASAAPPPAAPRPAPQVTTAPPAASAAETAEIAQQLEENRRRIKQVEEDRRRRIGEAQTQLTDAQSTMGPLHPTVVAYRQKLETLTAEPPTELTALRAQEKELVSVLASSAPRAAPQTRPSYGGPTARGVAPPGPQGETSLRGLLEQERDDAPTAFARQKLQSATFDYNDILNRIDAARIELDVAKAAFKYTYTVARPAEVPAKPRKPNVPIIVLGGLVGALLLAVVAAGIRDMMTGRFVETWQAEAGLGIPLLGELPPTGGGA
jgi:uncharacterized protein involved in exopolysaccharide biosynthesis